MKNETERLKLRQKYRNEVNPVLAEKHTPKDTYTFTDEYVFWLEEQLVKNINVIPCCESDSEQLCDDWIHKERVKQNDDKYCPICGKKLQ